MVRHDTEYIYTQGRLPVLYVNTDVEELVIHNTVLSSYIRLKLPLLLRMENWRNFAKKRLLLEGHAVVNSIRAVELTVSYQTRARPCLFLFIFLLLLLFTRLLFLSIAFSLPILSLLLFFSFWFFLFLLLASLIIFLLYFPFSFSYCS